MEQKKEMIKQEYIYNAKVIAIHDGDTITASIDLGLNISHIIKIRLAGINAPELTGKTKADGIDSRAYLRQLIGSEEILIQTIKDSTEKYGRYLGIIWIGDVNVNDHMIEAGYAIKYIL